MTRRSVLFSPGDRPDVLRKAATTDADVLAFDLEDAVAPDRTEAAREAVAEVLSDPEFDPDAEVCVRVGAVGSRADADVRGLTVAGGRPDAVIAPKVGSADAIGTLDDILAERDCRAPILALIETAAGVLAAPEIAAAEPTDAVIFGAEDFAADVGATRTDEGTEVLYARERIVSAAAAAGVDAIDTLHTDYEDDAGLRADAARAVELGFDGKLTVHPRQVPIVNDAFTPAPERIEWAERVLAGAAKARATGRAVFAVDGEMIDEPLIERARTIRDRARAAGIEFDTG
ncbi:CoA ester lyase [Halobacteriales archaeon SW_7_68_16]|nr:MAG: CoA ester lyase [Halobacteriales archaeon SW_7_68_16]